MPAALHQALPFSASISRLSSRHLSSSSFSFCRLSGFSARQCSPRHFAAVRATVGFESEKMAASEGLVATHGIDNCIFCKIRDGVIPSYKVLETDHALAFLDAFPMAKGHALLIPKKHYPFMEDMPGEEAAAFLKELPLLAKAVQKATGAKGVNIFQNNGAPAGQVVFHVHVHVLPCTEGGGPVKFGKSGSMIQKEEAEHTQESIKKFLPMSSL